MGRGRWPMLGLMLALSLTTLGVALGTIGYCLTAHDVAAVSPALMVSATLHSLGYALAANIVTTTLALPIAFLLVRYRARLVSLMERASFLPRGMCQAS